MEMGEAGESLAKKKCVPCEKGVLPLGRGEAERYLKEVACLPAGRGGDWRLSGDGKAVEVLYVMKDFMAAVRFIQEIAKIAEEENHHPDLHLTGYRKLLVQLSTHAIGGLSENDFILAAKIHRLPKELKATNPPCPL
ncbi:MAG: 4a-hydroxytetrahydrobiopterin dehydratase [Candidatus Omnitrophica bacterium]|nr:4a-hydroxytetrahydrobiopterin dehydratase [Candidatus Omnitrophota bacterium]